MKRTRKMPTEELAVPTLFASYRLGDHPSAGLRFLPWEITETEALLINAYDFTRPKYASLINNGWRPDSHLAFRDKPILIDSRAYYFRKHDNVAVALENVLDVELKSCADVGVVLDRPFPPDATDKAKRIDTTIKNTGTMLRALEEHLVWEVIDAEDTELAARQIIEYMDAIYDIAYPILPRLENEQA